MYKKLLLMIGCLLCFSIVFFGCKSKPEDEKTESPVEEVGPEQPLTKEQMEKLANDLISAAKQAKQLIEDNGFQPYDQESYDAGCGAIKDYEDLVARNAPIKKQYEMAKNANSLLQSVLDKAYMDLASKKKVEVEAIRKSNLDIKSDKASKENFDSAESNYMAGQDAFNNKAYQSSYENYCEAEKKFTSLYSEVSEKRALAEQEIEKAKEKNAKVNEFAIQADEIAPLSDDVAGNQQPAESQPVESQPVEKEAQ